jgi:single-stranded-DNA-specific exonuclease
LRYRWLARPAPAPGLEAPPDDLSFLPRSIALLLARRGMTPGEVRTYLDPSLDDLSPPDSLPGVTEAVHRIAGAVGSGERIMIHGDYDADGITATALACVALRRLGADADYFLPDRFADGYGLSDSGVKACLESGAGLMLTVDCGTGGSGMIAELAAGGVDTVVTDHHMPGDGTTGAIAVVNPQLGDGACPWSSLSGAGVAYRTMEAVCRELTGDRRLVEDLLPLAAIGTVCDVVPLTGESRILVSQGLRRMPAGSITGLAALSGIAGVDTGSVSARDLAFAIGPRLNSAGRVGHASVAVELLTTEDDGRALELAREIEDLNSRRRNLDARVLDDARMMAARQSGARILVLASEDWHQGVIGIAASRLVSEVGVPVVLVSLDGDRGRGSARSVQGISIHGLLEDVQHDTGILDSFGGHHMAAGLSIGRGSLDVLREELEKRMEAHASQLGRARTIWLDGLLDDGDFTGRTVEALRMMEPFGEGNEEPVWLARSVVPLAWRSVGNGQHLSCTFRLGGQSVRAIGFHMSDLQPMLGGPVDLAFCLREDNWKGRNSIQLHLRDIRPAGAAE